MANFPHLARDSLASFPKHFSFPQYGTRICFQTLNRIIERKQEKYCKGRPGLIPEASTLTAMLGNYAKLGSVFVNEHSVIVKYKVFNSFVNITEGKKSRKLRNLLDLKQCVHILSVEP